MGEEATYSVHFHQEYSLMMIILLITFNYTFCWHEPIKHIRTKCKTISITEDPTRAMVLENPQST